MLACMVNEWSPQSATWRWRHETSHTGRRRPQKTREAMNSFSMSCSVDSTARESSQWPGLWGLRRLLWTQLFSFRAGNRDQPIHLRRYMDWARTMQLSGSSPWPLGHDLGSAVLEATGRQRDPFVHSMSQCHYEVRFVKKNSHYSQWIGLRENLQETTDFPIKYPVKFPWNQSIDTPIALWDCCTFWEYH